MQTPLSIMTMDPHIHSANVKKFTSLTGKVFDKKNYKNGNVYFTKRAEHADVGIMLHNPRMV